MLKIAITGPESTGKSALCEMLAQYFETLWVPEFARTYLQNKQTPYSPEMLNEIADGQISSENEMATKANRILFCDTDMTVMKVWSEHAFGKSTSHIENLYNSQKHDLYLLADIDLAWEPDALREHPHLRQYFFDKYKELLNESGHPFKIVSGTGEIRFKNAIQLVEQFLHKNAKS